MISKKCPSKEQLLSDVLSTMKWSEIAKKYGYANSRFLEKKAREWNFPNKIRKYKSPAQVSPSHTRLYSIWYDIKRRCYQPQNKRYENYGGKGIQLCEEWKNFQNFLEWSLKNGYKENLTIDRIDNSKNYSPQNCRWATLQQQANNRTNNHFILYKGEYMSLADWSRRLNINYSTLRARLRSGWSIKSAFEKEVIKDDNRS